LILTSHQWTRATSLDKLLRIDQRRQVDADDVNLQFGAIDVLRNGAGSL
jgi:hypothetical protein